MYELRLWKIMKSYIYIAQIRTKNNYLFCSSFTSSRVKIRFSREETEDCVK